MLQLVKRIWGRLATFFLAGVFVILPVVITVAVVIWVANYVYRYIGPGTTVGRQLQSLGVGYAADTTTAYLIGWVVVLAIIFVLGVIVELGAKRLVQQLTDGILSRIPLIGSIYSTSRQFVDMLNKRKDEANLKGTSAVFCQFGEDRGAGVLALLVSPSTYHINGRDYHIVIVPTAPVPFGGGLMFVPVENVHRVQMSVDGLMSIYVSMGVTAPQFLKKA